MGRVTELAPYYENHFGLPNLFAETLLKQGVDVLKRLILYWTQPFGPPFPLQEDDDPENTFQWF